MTSPSFKSVLNLEEQSFIIQYVVELVFSDIYDIVSHGHSCYQAIKDTLRSLALGNLPETLQFISELLV